MVRKLKHPIATFVVAVLVVIGIGVGVVAATTSQTVYGPSWGRFTVAFPGHACGPPFPIGTKSRVIYEFAPSLPSKCAVDWTGYAPLAYPVKLYSVDVWGHIVTPSAMRGYVRLDRNLLFSGHVAEQVRNVNGFVMTTLGPKCTNSGCTGVAYISNGRVMRTLTVISPQSVSTVQAFMDSFEPIG